jgi:hypothetical protein
MAPALHYANAPGCTGTSARQAVTNGCSGTWATGRKAGLCDTSQYRHLTRAGRIWLRQHNPRGRCAAQPPARTLTSTVSQRPKPPTSNACTPDGTVPAKPSRSGHGLRRHLRLECIHEAIASTDVHLVRSGVAQASEAERLGAPPSRTRSHLPARSMSDPAARLRSQGRLIRSYPILVAGQAADLG